ncbi:hypothetical protein PR048_020274 [Dryococelus australis]|uniref:Uncharacterized protein n=1 Tax=Dryococelus australis TaxID=614101 RepID=A0ABQ9H628_9NEOP|nr:hypothetical protein PR048_020274 [Dryococelus australis]
MTSLARTTAATFIKIYQLLKEKKRTRKPRWWIKELYRNRVQYGKRLLQETYETIEDTVQNFTRMTLVEFERLHELISSQIGKRDIYMREAITVKERLAITLRFLATGDSFTILQLSFLCFETVDIQHCSGSV